MIDFEPDLGCCYFTICFYSDMLACRIRASSWPASWTARLTVEAGPEWYVTHFMIFIFQIYACNICVKIPWLSVSICS